jgi:polar amino acid transport system substrate-binding protein
MRRLLALAAAAALVLAGCGYDETRVPKADATSAPSSAAPSPAPTCDASTALRSYAPPSTLPGPGALPAGSTMAKIRKRGRLIAGVSADTYLLGSRNPLTGRIEGFDIDFVHQLAAAILGNPDRVQLRVITAADRLPVLQKDEVDVVVRNMTINCTRWESIAFSAEYYASGQKILVRKGSDITGLSTLAGHKVCAPTGTSSLDNLRRLAPKATAVEAPNHTSCMVKFQQGDVDAITGDDTVLAGLASQDPYAVVLKEKPFTSEPYGIGVNKDHVDLVRFINGVLEKMRGDGAWENSYRTWLAPTLGRSPGQPRPQYGRQP